MRNRSRSRNGAQTPQFDGEQCAPAPAGENGKIGRITGTGQRQAGGFAHAMNQGDATMNFDKELDARGLSCPLPILKTKKALNDLASGQVLKVVATDPGSVKDMQAFANQTGNPLLSTAEEAKDYVFFLRKK
jgi:tRNA 2-thiouridine synthesizing protein A